MHPASPNSEDVRRRLAALATLTGWLPVIAVNLAYLTAVSFDALPNCIPYFEGCASISSTGRVFPSEWIFKPLMSLGAVLTGWFFFVSGRHTGQRLASFDWLVFCGLASSLALLTYLLFLGYEGPTYRLLRRYGVSLYFGFVLLGQLLLARRLAQGSADLAPRVMLVLCAVLLSLGLVSIPITNFVADKDAIENTIEWNFALLLQVNFLLAGRSLRRFHPPG